VDANDDVGPVHDRMPLLVASGDRDLWLGGRASVDELARLVAPPPEGTLVAREVSSRVNAPSEDDSGLIEPV
jgi:putative SOS response-associated peptidase YedK